MAVDDRIRAAVMPAPRRPIEIREFPRPDLHTARLCLHRPGRGVRHRRSSLARPFVWRALSDHSRTCLRRHGSDPWTPLQSRWSPARRRRSCCFLRRPPNVRPLSTLHRSPHADPMRCSARLRNHGLGRRGTVRRLGAAIHLEPGVAIAHLPDNVSFDDYIGGGCGLLTAVHILERAALRPADTVLVQGTGAVGPRCDRARPVGRRRNDSRDRGAGGALI